MAGPELGSAESNDETAPACSDVVSTCDVFYAAAPALSVLASDGVM